MTIDEPRQGHDPQKPTPDMLLWAYCHGIFPMADCRHERIEWFSPDPRGIIPLGEFHASRTLLRAVRSQRIEVTSNRAFRAVMEACATPRREDDLPWIDRRLVDAYVGLHERGCAHSIEAWHAGWLVGGLYGVHIGGAFFGESMFVKPDHGGTNASKICLVHLVEHLKRQGFALLDTQFWNEHLEQFGCTEIPREIYLRRLGAAIVESRSWGTFDSARAARCSPRA